MGFGFKFILERNHHKHRLQASAFTVSLLRTEPENEIPLLSAVYSLLGPDVLEEGS